MNNLIKFFKSIQKKLNFKIHSSSKSKKQLLDQIENDELIKIVLKRRGGKTVKRSIKNL